YYLYTQWLAAQQMEQLSGAAHREGVRLHLDLPLGVHPLGYDAWRMQREFVQGASAGAPPDMVFTSGQDWGTPVVHPERSRERGYDYFVRCVRHHMAHAGILRVDHVMGLHRLFWIPKERKPEEGLYVRNHAEELYAILALESQRHGVIVVGEDLGTVPPHVRPSMEEHGLYRMHVVQYELESSPERALSTIPERVVAGLNTHDMPPFAGWWQGVDVEQRGRCGLLGAKGAVQEREKRERLRRVVLGKLGLPEGTERLEEAERVVQHVLGRLAESQAQFVMINTEDLWGETEPQNIPGPSEGAVNWRRKAGYEYESFSRLKSATKVLRLVDQKRRRARGGQGVESKKKEGP
ncbi:MAG: 4-alpha-glucanotransferase, partial [Chloroflexota bacterium]